jgi:hypothetical protein
MPIMPEAVLVIFACLAGDCHPFVVSPPMPQALCMTYSQPAAAHWAGSHPNHEIRKIVCADPRRLAAFLGRGQA